jgi:hypothetical protein
LSFANINTNLASRLFGGSFGSALCANDYFAQVPDSVTPSSVSSVDIGTLDTGVHYYDNDVTLSGLIPNGRRVVVYVDGNVSLIGSGGRIGYQNPTTWPTVQDIPSFYLVARGNVYVDNDITEMDGSYIAQPDPANIANTGEIYSCSLVGTRLDVSTDFNALSIGCRNQLRVYGSFIAKQVHLLRTAGSIRFSIPEESPNPPAPAAAGEVFIYSPTVWFTEGGKLPANKKIQIDSYTSLPPAL